MHHLGIHFEKLSKDGIFKLGDERYLHGIVKDWVIFYPLWTFFVRKRIVFQKQVLVCEILVSIV